jgi:spore coat polysaccharide biosynthesis predicted glycosyltransferase SpsG
VTLGAADPDNVTLKVITALEAITVPGLAVRVVVGPSNPHLEEIRREADRSAAKIEILCNVRDMPGLMSWADLAVTAGGSTCWELAFMGTPAVVMVVAENQRLIARGLEAAGMAVNLGEYRSLTRQGLEEALRLLKADSGMRAQMSRRGKAMVDGLGAERVVSAIGSAKYWIS